MRKFAVFVEGLSEQIFIRYLVRLMIDNDKLSFDCFNLLRGGYQPARYSYPNKNAEVYFRIINVGGDEAVLTAIKEREKGLIQEGFEKIIGLRDMYSEKYLKRSNKIDRDVIDRFLKGWHATIQEMSNPSKIKMHVSIMELEAWFLGIPNVFERFNSVLTIDNIIEKLDVDLKCVDPQEAFFHPSIIVDKIFRLIDRKYKKSEDDLNGICSRITRDDVLTIIESGKCKRFVNLYEEILA